MCVMDLDRCGCDCHRMEGISHMSACCDTCPECGEHIKIWAADRHAEGHRNARDYREERAGD